MNQIKPFLFWIVIGAVLLLELAWWLLSIPDIDVVGNKSAALSAKAKLKVEEDHLKELANRAKRQSPSGVFDAEKEADIRRLTNDYLLTPAWKSVLEPHVNRYDLQLQEIKRHLADHSQALSLPLAASTDKFGWYTAYQNLTEEQLKRLAAAKALAQPGSATPKPAKTTGTQPTPTAAPVATQPAEVVTDYANDPILRALAGFYTKGADLPEATEHPALTRQYRTMERIIEVVLGTAAANEVNPLTGVSDLPEAGPAAFAGVVWNPKGDQLALGDGVASHAAAWSLTLTLQGPVSTLLATTSALEHPKGSTKPLIIVTGCEIARKPTFVAGERKDTGSEVAVAKLTLVVLDFTHPSPTTTAGATPGNPGDPAAEAAHPVNPGQQRPSTLEGENP